MNDELQAAVRDHERGLLDDAARVYERFIAANPRHAVAWNLLGVVAHQQGEHSRAIDLIGQAVTLNPREAAFHANLAEACRAIGRFEQAVECCEAALRLEPNSPGAANNLGLARQALGQIEAAIAAFREALRLQPNFALAHNNLGAALRQAGRSDEALDHFRQAVAHDPGLSLAHSNLGQLLLERYQRQESLHHCREAVRLHPELAEAQNNLGNVLRELGRLPEAHVAYAAALRMNPNLALTCNNLGQAFQEQGQLDQACVWYRRAEQLDPNSARIHSNLGSLFQELDQNETATSHYERALRLDRTFPEAHHGLGWVHHDQGRFDTALKYYREALRLRPDYALAHCSLGMLVQEMGDLEQAQSSFREALRHDPDHAGGHAELATLLRGKLPDDDLASLTRMVADPNLSDGRRSAVYFGLAQVCDARREYAGSAEHLERANSLSLASRQQRGQAYDTVPHERLVAGLIDTFKPTYFERVRGFGIDTRRPIFIVGLPRSGTTLTEQILASHSQVFGAGELGLAGATFNSLPRLLNQDAAPWELAKRLDGPIVAQIARDYLAQLDAIEAHAPRIVDKMPDNYLYLGLIATLFPQAKIIHCRRDLRDTAVSCWMTNFRQIRWANRFEHIASRFEAYSRLMAHWRRVLPLPLLEVDYEQTVSDVEGTARRLLNWCGLHWEPGCAAFHEKRRPVRTASVMQVRQPAYQTSVARWKNYEQPLAPLFALVDSL